MPDRNRSAAPLLSSFNGQDPRLRTERVQVQILPRAPDTSGHGPAGTTRPCQGRYTGSIPVARSTLSRTRSQLGKAAACKAANARSESGGVLQNVWVRDRNGSDLPLQGRSESSILSASTIVVGLAEGLQTLASEAGCRRFDSGRVHHCPARGASARLLNVLPSVRIRPGQPVMPGRGGTSGARFAGSGKRGSPLMGDRLQCDATSSNGRTSDSGSENRGSSPRVVALAP